MALNVRFIMNHKYLSVLILLISGCSSLPDHGATDLYFSEKNGSFYLYNNQKQLVHEFIISALQMELNTNVVIKKNYMQTSYTPYKQNNEEYKVACRAEFKEIKSAKNVINIKCLKIKYEYGYQANSIHNLFTKTWWHKSAGDIERKIISRIENVDK